MRATVRRTAFVLAISVSLSGISGTVHVQTVAVEQLLEANPLEDIHDMPQIAAVVVDGRLFDGDDIRGYRNFCCKSVAPCKRR